MSDPLVVLRQALKPFKTKSTGIIISKIGNKVIVSTPDGPKIVLLPVQVKT